MKRYEYQTSFFLNKKENEAFVKYCSSKNVAPYIAGRTIVKDFLMPTEDDIEHEMIEDDYEERIGVLEAKIEAIGEVLKRQIENCEKLEEEVASLQEEIDWRGIDRRVESLEEDVISLINNCSILEQTALPEAN